MKTGEFAAADLKGLFELTRRHKELRPLVLCDEGGFEVARRAGVEARGWRAFLNDGIGGA